MALKYLRQAGIPLGVIGLAILIAAWMMASRPKALPKPPEEQVWPVSVVAATYVDIEPEISAFGEVRAAREAEIRPMVEGRLISLSPEFQDGQRVTAGTELAVINPADYESKVAEQRAELARLDAALSESVRELEWEQRLLSNAHEQVALSRRAFERSEKLAATGRESKKLRDESALALATAEQQVLQREQNIGRLKSRRQQQQAAFERGQATLSLAERDLAKTRVVAPFDGFVADVRLAQGKVVGVGETLGRLLAADELEVQFELPERHYARLLGKGSGPEQVVIGKTVKVIWRLGDNEETFAGDLVRVGAEIDASLGGIKLYAKLKPDAAARGLRAGAFVEVRLPETRYEKVLRVPQRALADDSSIYLLRDGRLARVQVEMVRDLGGELLIRGDIEPGENIVARSFAGIGPGLRARAL